MATEVQPEAIFVLGACPVEVIGDRFETVVAEVQAEHPDISMIALHTSGLKVGTQTAMLDWMFEALASLPPLPPIDESWRADAKNAAVEVLIGTAERSRRTLSYAVPMLRGMRDAVDITPDTCVNVVGLPGKRPRRSSVPEYVEVLGQGGLHVVANYPATATFDTWRSIRWARQSFVADRSLYPRLVGVLERSGQQVTEVPLPIGLEQTVELYETIGAATGKLDAIRAAVAPLADEARRHVETFRARFGGLRIAYGLRMSNNYEADPARLPRPRRPPRARGARVPGHAARAGAAGQARQVRDHVPAARHHPAVRDVPRAVGAARGAGGGQLRRGHPGGPLSQRGPARGRADDPHPQPRPVPGRRGVERPVPHRDARPPAAARCPMTDFTLEDFALKGMHLAKMTGAMAASHAISDSFLLMHSGVGCKYKTAAQASEHDLGEHPNVREAWTQVSELHLVEGSSSRIGPFARAWWERRRSHLMVVVSAYFIELTGDDIPAMIRQVESTVPDCDLVYVNTRAPNLGFFDGYASVLAAILKRMDWSRPVTQPGHVALVGHFFSRHEPDARADVGQLKALTKAAGLECGPVLLSGTAYKESLSTAPSCGVLGRLPYLRPRGDVLEGVAGKRAVVDLDLPMGVAGTRRFVRTLAARSGADTRKVDAWLDAQAAAIRPALDAARDQLGHSRTSVALFADTPLAAGLTTVLHELGIQVRLVGLRDQAGCLGGRAEFLRVLQANGVHGAESIEVLEAPSLRLVRQRGVDLLRSGVAAILGSTTELEVFRHLPRTWALTVSVPLIEVGYPSDHHHVVLNLPTLGFTGTAAWAQRLLEALRAPSLGSASTL